MSEAEPPDHLKPVLDAVYTSLERFPGPCTIMAIVRTEDDLAFVTNATGGDMRGLLMEMLANLDLTERTQ